MKKEAATFQQERDLAFEFIHLLSPTPQLTGHRELRFWCVCVCVLRGEGGCTIQTLSFENCWYVSDDSLRGQLRTPELSQGCSDLLKGRSPATATGQGITDRQAVDRLNSLQRKRLRKEIHGGIQVLKGSHINWRAWKAACVPRANAN